MKSLGPVEDICQGPSPSVRRAWIEIGDLHDPNVFLASPSVRRAWIEISKSCWRSALWGVALREEGVD